MADRRRRSAIQSATAPARVAAHGRPSPVASKLQHLAGNQAAQQILDGAGVPDQAALHPAIRRAIDDARPRGRPLAEATRAALGDLAGARSALGAVRVHDHPAAHELSAALGADAFTTGRDVFFAAGRFDPHGEAGRALLAHELLHVAQQGGAEAAGELRLAPPGGALETAAGALARGAPAQSALDRAPAGLVQRQVATAPPQPDTDTAAVPAEPEERRTSKGDASWWVETDPATPLAQLGRTVTFRLRTSAPGPFRFETARGRLSAYPEFVLRDPNGNESTHRPPTDPYRVAFDLRSPGRWRGTFRGTPAIPGGGPPERPFALYLAGASISVSLEVEVVDTKAGPGWGAKAAESPAREDVNRIEDPKASPEEAAVAFRRLATRRGFAVLESNRREAEELLRLYMGQTERPAKEALGDLEHVIELDIALDRQLSRSPSPFAALRDARSEGRKLSSAEDVHAYLLQKRERLLLAKELLVDAFPLIALIRGPWRGVWQAEPEKRETIVLTRLRGIIADIDATERNLASGRLDILAAEPVVAQVRAGLGLTATDPRSVAIDKAIEQYRSDEMKASLGLATAGIMLLFVPGIGPALAAAAGAGSAALSVQRASIMYAGAGAGVRGGIVSASDAASAGFWAVLEVVLAGVDVAAQLARAAKVLPHVAGSGARALSRLGRARAATALAEEAAAGGGSAAPLLLSAQELHTFAAEVLRRPLKPFTGDLVIHESAEELAKVYKARWPKKAATPGWRPPAGYFDPHTGAIHLNRQAGLMTALHEIIHRSSRELFPLGRQIWGHFLDEGMTEAVVRWKLGPRLARHAYDPHVAFVETLAGIVGPDIVERAVVHGDYRALRDAVKNVIFGGSEQKTFQFFALIRGLSPAEKASAYDRVILQEVMDMMGRGGKLPTAPVAPVPSPRGGGPHADPGATGGLTPQLTPKQEGRLSRAKRLIEGSERWADLGGTEPAKMGTLLHSLMEQLLERVFPGSKAVRRVPLTPALIATLRKQGGRAGLLECKLPSGLRMDIAELDFRTNRATIIDLTARSKVEHLTKSATYVKELRKLTGMEVQAMDMLYIDERGELAEMLIEVLTTAEKAK